MEQPTGRPLRIVFAILTLGGGGAERVATQLASGWAARGHHVTIVTLVNDDPAYPLSGSVHRRALRQSAPPRSKWGMFRTKVALPSAIRRAVREIDPDVLVSFIDTLNLAVLVATIGTGVPVVVSERVDPRYHRIGVVWRLLRRVLYRRAAAIVVQTEAIRPWGLRHAGSPDKVIVIPNPIDLTSTQRQSSRPRGDRQLILAAGRLTPQKGFDLLIDAFAEISDTYPTSSIRIFGEGPERRDLQNQIDTLGLTGRIVLNGWAPELRAELRRGDIFVLSSRYEGFPNVLLEAMSVGLAVVSFDCPSGPGEMIGHGINGLLVPAEDPDALAFALATFLSDPLSRAVFGAAARQRAADFDLTHVLTQWEDLLRAVNQGR